MTDLYACRHGHRFGTLHDLRAHVAVPCRASWTWHLSEVWRGVEDRSYAGAHPRASVAVALLLIGTVITMAALAGSSRT